MLKIEYKCRKCGITKKQGQKKVTHHHEFSGKSLQVSTMIVLTVPEGFSVDYNNEIICAECKLDKYMKQIGKAVK